MRLPYCIALSALSLLLVSASAYAQFGLKDLKKATDKALDVAKEVDRFNFSEQEEIELGEAISQRIRSRYGVVQDLEATRYVSLVGLSVSNESERARLPWRWIVLDSSAVNAFAAPGGFVHITRGALAVIQSEAELATVLAHEVAHVTQKHTIRALQKNMGMEIAQDQASFGPGSALFDEVADRAADSILAGFGQAEELESDEVGVQIAARAGYQPKGLSRFLTTLDGLHSGSDSGSVLFRSHPDTEKRIIKVDRQIRKEKLDDGLWLEERYSDRLAFEVASAGTGGPAVAGARGVAGSEGGDEEEAEPAADSEASAKEEKKKGGRFSLAKLARNPFKSDSKEESAEVSGAGAGRAVGKETDEVEGGPKNSRLVEITVTPAEVAAFRREGGLG